MPDYISRYLKFNRQQWSRLRNDLPLPLTLDEIAALKSINEDLSIQEVMDIYLPLARLLNLYIVYNVVRTQALDYFLNNTETRPPYIIGIAGSVAVGKSTTARILQALLSRWPEHRRVDLIATDGFLQSNEELIKKSLMDKKGFPPSYNIKQLIQFLTDLKTGLKNLKVPEYSHFIYDIVPDQFQIINQPDIVILEGLNVLQSQHDYPEENYQTFVSDFVDFSIYVDADLDQLKEWYINRFMQLRNKVFSDPKSYFHHFSQLSSDEARARAGEIWHSINERNLVENILPTRERADLILTKGYRHAVNQIQLRK